MTRDRNAGGFIEFPGDNYVPDPASTFTLDSSNLIYRSISVQQPQLAGTVFLLFYDRAASRWLPTNRGGVYPDGTRYAYVLPGESQSVHIVDVATGRERTFPAPHPIGGEVYDYSPNGIYLAGRGSKSESGLWLLDPQSGSERLVTSEKIVAAVRDGKAWLSQLSTAPNGWGSDMLVELDLNSGTKRTWFYRAGALVQLMAMTSAGLPIVTVRGSHGEELWAISSPGNEKKIYSGQNLFPGLTSSDSHGVWLASIDGVYLYSEPGGLQRVSSRVDYPAGACV